LTNSVLTMHPSLHLRDCSVRQDIWAFHEQTTTASGMRCKSSSRPKHGTKAGKHRYSQQAEHPVSRSIAKVSAVVQQQPVYSMLADISNPRVHPSNHIQIPPEMQHPHARCQTVFEGRNIASGVSVHEDPSRLTTRAHNKAKEDRKAATAHVQAYVSQRIPSTNSQTEAK
jgi:hypothetical protein